MKSITTESLVNSIRSRKGAEFITIVTNTDARLLKRGNPNKNVRKISTVNVTVGFDYTSSVNKQRTREELESEFVAQPRKWGERIDLKTVGHNGGIYLTYKGEKCLNTRYVGENGEEISKDVVAPFLPKKSKPKTQGTEKEIIYRDVAVGNITQINFRGGKFEVC